MTPPPPDPTRTTPAWFTAVAIEIRPISPLADLAPEARPIGPTADMAVEVKAWPGWSSKPRARQRARPSAA